MYRHRFGFYVINVGEITYIKKFGSECQLFAVEKLKVKNLCDVFTEHL